MPKFKPIPAGSKRWRLTVVRDKQSGKPLQCICDCGSPVSLRWDSWGKTKSCGCARADAQRARLTTHGLARTPEYKTWVSMIARCTNPRNDNWSNYGGRGIMVCERWMLFVDFYADMAPRPPGKTIDRIDNDSGYRPDNCRWATPVEQRANQRDRKRTNMCRRGLHELTPDNVWSVGAGRTCKACRKVKLVEWNAPKRPQLDAPAK